MTFVKANKDTYITSMRDDDNYLLIKKGDYLFHITSDKQTKFLDPGEIAVYFPNNGLGVCYTWERDWDEDDPHD